jgi:HPt (histidine-containing phosphotransfer) domain-containing protein
MDTAFFQQHTMNNKKLQEEMIEIFSRQIPVYLKEMKEALNTQDITLWKKVHHTIRGTALDMGFSQLSNLAFQAENSQNLCHTLAKEIEDSLITSRDKAWRFLENSN